MKKIFTLLAVAFAGLLNAQTLVYSTGQTYNDDWTGWTTPVTTNVSGSMFSANTWTFNVSGTFSIETTRQFSINSQDLDIYWAATMSSGSIEVQHSTDGTNWTLVQNLNYTSGTFGQQTMVIPTFNPSQENFYLKLRATGVAGTPPSCIFNQFYINADLNNPFTGGSASIGSLELGKGISFINDHIQILVQDHEYLVNVYDVTGRMIGSEKNMTDFDLSSYPNGAYFVSLINGDTKQTLKIAK